MDCKNCEQKQRQFYCRKCTGLCLKEARHQLHNLRADRDAEILKSTIALDFVKNARNTRASVASSQARLEHIKAAIAQLQADNQQKRLKLSQLRSSLLKRRSTLSTAVAVLPSSPASVSGEITRAMQTFSSLTSTLARARSGLVQELVEVFRVVEVGGRPPIGGKAGTKGEWTIGDLILPVPGDIRRYPPDHINAVLTHTIQFLSLLTFYLGVKLPFEITWSGKKLGVGMPTIGAGRGGESGGWARWHTRHPLHLSSVSSSSAATSAQDPPVSPDLSASITLPPLSPSVSDSFVEQQQPVPPASSSSFTTALAMLLYNVCYLAHTQGVDVPLAQAGDVLSNLWAVCCSTELGRHSHETHPILAPPTPPSFGMDFQQLLQATTAPRAKNVPNQKNKTDSSSRTHRPKASSSRAIETIIEDDGWDLVGDATDGFE